MSLAKICLFHAVYFSKLDLFVFERCGSFFVMRSKSFAVSAPATNGFMIRDKLCANKTYHGAKNSTKMRGSGLTEESKVPAVRLKTSEASSATAREAKAKTDAACEKREEKRIAFDGGVGRRGTWNWRRGAP